MEVKGIKGTGIGAYDIMNVAPSEMDKMIEMRNRIFEVLKSHDKDCKDKQYLDDKELEYLWVMLCVLTEGVNHRAENSFDAKLRKLAFPFSSHKSASVKSSGMSSEEERCEEELCAILDDCMCEK
jgi:hypothetical protein